MDPLYPKAMPRRNSGKPAAKKQKTTARSSSKPAFQDKTVRSRAFAKAVLQAKPYTLSGERLTGLLKECARTVARLPREPFRNCRSDLFVMLRLLKAFQAGDYKIPQNDLL